MSIYGAKPPRCEDEGVGGVDKDSAPEVARCRQGVPGTLPGDGEDHDGGLARGLGHRSRLGTRPALSDQGEHLGLRRGTNPEGGFVPRLGPALMVRHTRVCGKYAERSAIPTFS
jgi:hypothetical protein